MIGFILFISLPTLAYTMQPGDETALKFPLGFKFGAATASYQVEGAWNVSDKGESIWDRHTHDMPHMIADGSNGDVAADSYHQYMKDVKNAADLGLNYYRFSISWPRLLPDAYAHTISEDGKNYYNNLIDALLAHNIEPVVTLYHWDLPQKLQDLGGWANPLIADWFADYANVVYSLYGDRVKTWLTINEPLAVCDITYNSGELAPFMPDPDRASYVCSKNLLLAHAKAWRIYDTYYKPSYGGRVSIINLLLWFEGETEADLELGEMANQYSSGRYMHPIYSREGGWPSAIEKLIEDNSRNKGYPRSRLPIFTHEEKEFIRGTYDFFAMNHYSSRAIRPAKTGEDIGNFFAGNGAKELNAKLLIRSTWRTTAQALLPANPQGFRKALNWVKDNYGAQEIFIAENGYSDVVEELDDSDRIVYMKEYMEQMLYAINVDKINVTAYTYWSLIDNFEWMDGYTSKFGLYHVDFNSPDHKRTPRKSAHYYRSIIRNHSLNVPVQPDTWDPQYYNLKKMLTGNAARNIRYSHCIYLLLTFILLRV